MKNDLQYACIFPLPIPRDCSAVPSGIGCDCTDFNIQSTQNPLCQQDDGSYSSIQHFAKGYPGVRHLEVAKDFGENAIVASICPKVTSGSPSEPAYGYNPAVDAIIGRLGEALSVKCVNRPLTLNPDGSTNCSIVEVTAKTGACSCNPTLNRSDVSPSLGASVLSQLGMTGSCGPLSAAGTPCTSENFCLCTINPAPGSDCKTQEVPPPNLAGWCYIDPQQDPSANPNLVSECDPPRLLRFVGDDTPKSGSVVFISCGGG